ncbi:helix-turn-helix domain-containing protein [Paenibacillus sp. MBLB4367]|uniref:helix-turn-helix domain-containing protein n=1 Tax=Paenibacillus sp. MBLB4367 TaxID=3384767 RepID=UPI00390807E3
MGQSASGFKPFPYEPMLEQPHALDKLDIRFRWGDYGVKVLKFHLTTFPQGKVVDYHKHSEFELHFIPRGKGKLLLEDGEHSLSAGLMYVTGPNVLHRQEADMQEAMDELCLHVDLVRLPARASGHVQEDDWGGALERAEAEQCVERLSRLPAVPVADRNDAMQSFLTAYRAWYDGSPGLYTILKQSVIHILLKTVNAQTKQPPQVGLPSRDMHRYRYQLAVQFIHDNYMMPLTVEHVAERAQISARQLQRVFRSQTGETFGDYLERYRLTQICRQLELSGDSIHRIAEASGFASSNYLHHVFKKRFGETPLAYRERHRKGV